MLNRSKTVALIVATLLAACSHGSTVPAPSNPIAERSASQLSLSSSAVITGNFTEYALPAGVNPSDLAHGPYDTLWFTQFPVTAFPPPPGKVWQMVKTTGNLHAFTAGFVPGAIPPTPFSNAFSSPIFSAGRAIWFLLLGTQDNVFLTRLTPEGAFSYTPDNAGASYTNFTLGSDGRVWYGACDDCGFLNNTIVKSVSGNFVFGPSLNIGNHVGGAITAGPGGNLYLTVFLNNATPPASNTAVDVISTAGKLLHTYALPNDSSPTGIVTGADHNLWIADSGTSSRINSIVRMTPTGTVTKYPLPTANSGVDRITYGADNALWFTETDANKIGRITTTGQIKEFTIPTAGSQPTGIVTCTTECPPHGGVWFTETHGDKIGKFVSPL